MCRTEHTYVDLDARGAYVRFCFLRRFCRSDGKDGRIVCAVGCRGRTRTYLITAKNYPRNVIKALHSMRETWHEVR